jgi:hypothetical protein
MQKEVKKRTREVLRRYKFAVDGKAARVCKKMFVLTLGFGIKTVDCCEEKTGY